MQLGLFVNLRFPGSTDRFPEESTLAPKKMARIGPAIQTGVIAKTTAKIKELSPAVQDRCAGIDIVARSPANFPKTRFIVEFSSGKIRFVNFQPDGF